MALLSIHKTKQSLEIGRKKVIIGRHSGDDLVLQDPKSSRSNSEIEFIDGKYILKDRGSRNGTFLNGEKVTSDQALKFNDVILIGSSEIIFTETPEKVDLEISGYDIIEHTASGGMGKVYKARQLSLDRIVAIKVLSDKFTHDSKFTDNFIKEARAAGRLNHPNLVQVHDVTKDITKNGTLIYYFIMEFVDGSTIKELIREQKKIDPIETVNITIEICNGLDYIHSNNLVHRDIKPDNLMFDSENKIKIADLGIALDKGEETPDETGKVKRIVGTPHFLSPEQARGKEIDARSDIYSLGATLYHMVTGETPFEGANAKEIIHKHLKESPIPCHERDPSIPIQISDLIMWMLEKNKNDRPQTAKEVSEELHKILKKLKPSIPKKKRIGHKTQKLSPIGIAIAGAIGLGVGILCSSYFFSGPKKPPSIIDITENTNPKTAILTNEELEKQEILLAQKEAKALTDAGDFEGSISIYKNLISKYPNHKELPTILKLVEQKLKNKNQKEEQKVALQNSQKLEADGKTALLKADQYRRENNNIRSAPAIIQMYNDILTKYPNTSAAKESSKRLLQIKEEQTAIANQAKMNALRVELSNANNPSERKNILLSAKSKIKDKKHLQWINEQIKEISNDQRAAQQSIKNDLDSLNDNIKSHDYSLALDRAKIYLKRSSDSFSKKLIQAKINDIEKKAEEYYKKNLIQIKENLRSMNFDNAIMPLKAMISKLKDTRTNTRLLRYIKKAEALQTLHGHIIKLANDKKIKKPLDFSLNAGKENLHGSIESADERKLIIKFNSAYSLPKLWSNFTKIEIFLIYRATLNHAGQYTQHKSTMDFLKKLNKLSDEIILARTKVE